MSRQKRKKRGYHFKHSFLARWWRKYEYKHTTMAFLAIVLFIVALDTAIVQASLEYVEEMGVVGIFIAGMMFTSFFTTAPAVVMLVEMAAYYNPLTIAVYGAMGSVVGDWIILKIFEEKVGYELLPLAKKFHLKTFIRSLRRKKNRERTTLLGMAVIASPLPDELGIGLMGLAHLPLISLLIITYLLNAAGILILLMLT